MKKDEKKKERKKNDRRKEDWRTMKTKFENIKRTGRNKGRKE